jgi:hypothetical protein
MGQSMSELIITCVKCGYRMHIRETICMNCAALDEYSKRDAHSMYITQQKRLRQAAQKTAKKGIA